MTVRRTIARSHDSIPLSLLLYDASLAITKSLPGPSIERLPPAQPRSLPRSLTVCPYFCSFVISWSPCLTTSLYCLFLSSGLFVSITPRTRSTVQGTRSAAMNFERSLL